MDEESPKVFFGMNRTRTSLLARTEDIDIDTQCGDFTPLTANVKEHYMRLAQAQQIDDTCITPADDEAAPCRCLLLAIFERTILDLSLNDKKERRVSAKWIFSNSTERWSALWCAEQAGEDIEKFRRRAREAIAASNSEQSLHGVIRRG